MPIIALVVVLRAHIVRIILGTGHFNWTDTRLTAAAFALFVLSLAAQSVTLLLVRGYYAAGRTYMPFAVAAATASLTIVLGYVGIHALNHQIVLGAMESFMRVDGLTGTTVLALAYAYAIAAILGSFFLLAHFEYRFRGLVQRIARSFFESIAAAVTGGVAAYFVLSFTGPIEFYPTTISVFTHGFAAGAIGLIVSTVTYYLLGSREYMEISCSIQSRIGGLIFIPKEATISSTSEQ
jgi:putative peptidoglycan lipid II flippase